MALSSQARELHIAGALILFHASTDVPTALHGLANDRTPKFSGPVHQNKHSTDCTLAPWGNRKPVARAHAQAGGGRKTSRRQRDKVTRWVSHGSEHLALG